MNSHPVSETDAALSVLAGATVGFFVPDWLVRIGVPLLWGGLACLYHSRFSTMERRLFVEERHREGQSRQQARRAFYARKFRRAAAAALVAALLAGLARDLLAF